MFDEEKFGEISILFLFKDNETMFWRRGVFIIEIVSDFVFFCSNSKTMFFGPVIG